MQLSDVSKKILSVAEAYARKSGGIIGTEHIITGILSVDCPARDILAQHGIDVNQYVRRALSAQGESGGVELSDRVKRMLKDAQEAASSAGEGEITPEHLLYVILRDPSSFGVRALRSFIPNVESIAYVLEKGLRDDDGDSDYDGDYEGAYGGMQFGDDGDSDYDGDYEGAYGGMQFGDDGEPKKATGKKALDKLGVDLTDKAKKGKLDPVIGRSKEIERIIQILSRRTKNNPVLIGEPGVGKSAIVEGLAQAIVEGNVPEILKNKKVFSLEMASVLAGTKYRGEFEEKLQEAINTIKKDGNTILFIDEIHTIVGAGSSDGNSVDAANILKPLLARGELQTIGATTIDEYRKYIEKDAALERRFQPIMVDPPSVEDTVAILKGLRDKYEAHHKVTITDEAIEAAAEMSERYISDRFLPDKAIDLIDEAASKKRINNFTAPEEVKVLEDKLARIEVDLKEAVKREEFDKAAKFKKEKQETADKLADEKKKWADNRKEIKLSINADDIAEIVSSWTSIPVVKLTESEADRLLHLEDILKKRVIGQDEAVSAVAKAVRRARAGLKDPNKPIGSFIFLGPTGVGKTELTKALAEAMFGDENLLVRLDMSEYMDKINVSKLIGSAPGYVGYDEGGQLTEKVRRKPYSVVLFDEIEKAHPDVFNLLLQIMDDGRLTDSHGRTVSFKNTVIIMTSNIGASEIKNSTKLGFGSGGESAEESYEKMKEKQMEALKRTMKPEFINRIDDIIIFKSLAKEDITAIADILVGNLAKRLKEQNITIEVSDKAKEFIVSKGFNTEYGARPLKRALQKHLEDELSEHILLGKVAIGDKVNVDSDGEKLLFSSVK